MQRKHKTLRQKIRGYQRIKWLAASPLIAVGIVGVVLPVIPGLPFLAAGMALITPLKPQQRKHLPKDGTLEL